jgi:hypothetical protein
VSVRVREHKGTLLAVAVGVAALTVHLLAGRLAILTASRWMGGIAIGLAVTLVTVLHLEALRRLVARRGRASNARRNVEATMTSQHDDVVEQHHRQAQHDQAQDRAHPEHGHGRRHAHEDGVGLPGALAGAFRPHTDDAGDRIDSALAASAAGMRALKISLAGLGATAVIQFLVVLASGSVALLADTIHEWSRWIGSGCAGSATSCSPRWRSRPTPACHCRSAAIDPYRDTSHHFTRTA